MNIVKSVRWTVAIVLLLLSPMVTHFTSTHNVRHNMRLDLPSAHLVALISGEYRGMLSTMLWIYLNDYMGSNGKGGDSAYIAHVLDIITTLTPFRDKPYYIAASYLAWDSKSFYYSRPLLVKAMKNLPDDWRWPYYMGFNYFWFTGDIRQSAKYMDIAARETSAPAMVKDMAIRFRAKAFGLRNAIQTIHIAYKKETSTRDKAALRKMLDTLKTEFILREVESGHIKFSTGKKLPDGGNIVYRNGKIYSSKESKRYDLFLSKHYKEMRKNG